MPVAKSFNHSSDAKKNGRRLGQREEFHNARDFRTLDSRSKEPKTDGRGEYVCDIPSLGDGRG